MTVTTAVRGFASKVYSKWTSTAPYELIPNYGSVSISTNPVLPDDATKIEPKVFLASERTFLTWLRVALLISTFALTLYNTAGDGDWVAKGMGLTYAALALLVLAYARYMHERRRKRIIGRFAGHHGKICPPRVILRPSLTDRPLLLPPPDEPYGPLLLCIAIFLAVLVNFILRVQQR